MSHLWQISYLKITGCHSLSLSLPPLNDPSLFLSLMLPWNTEIVMVWLLSWPKGNDWVSEFVYRLGDGFRMDSGNKNVLFYCLFLGNSASQWQWFLNTGGDDNVCDSNEWVLVFGGIMSDLRIWSLQKLWSFRIGHGHTKDSTTCVLTMWVEKIYTILKNSFDFRCEYFDSRYLFWKL